MTRWIASLLLLVPWTPVCEAQTAPASTAQPTTGATGATGATGPIGAIGATGATGAIGGRIKFSGDPATLKGVHPGDAVVFLRGAQLRKQPASSKSGQTPTVLDQVDLTFTPHVVPIVVGHKLTVRNSDAVLHNFNTNSKVNPVINVAQIGNTSKQVTFDKPEVMHVGCNIHSQMSAYIVVVPNRFFAKADTSGNYQIRGIPPGSYTLVAWHELSGETTRKVLVRAGESVSADFSLARQKSQN